VNFSSRTPLGKPIRLFWALLTIGALSPCLMHAQDPPLASPRLIAYYTSWSKYNNPPYAYSSKQIPYTQLTHIEHAFVLLNAKANGVLTVPKGFLEAKLISDAHAAGVKVLLSIGGSGNNQWSLFSKMAQSEKFRQAFVKNVHTFLTKHKYDGVDIDWEFPASGDLSDCTTLMQELRNGLPAPWLISMAVPANGDNTAPGLNIPALAPIVDFFNVMTYDFTGAWDPYAGLNSPLYQDPADPLQTGSVKTSMDLYQNTYGVSSSQLNIGTPFYGYEFQGADALWEACGSCTVSQQNYGSYIKPLINEQGWEAEFDNAAQSPYLVNTASPGFITYDNTSSVSAKTTYILKTRGFGGVFIWDLSQDYDGKSQDLLNSMYTAWKAAK
jgi:chitinase